MEVILNIVLRQASVPLGMDGRPLLVCHSSAPEEKWDLDISNICCKMRKGS